MSTCSCRSGGPHSWTVFFGVANCRTSTFPAACTLSRFACPEVCRPTAQWRSPPAGASEPFIHPAARARTAGGRPAGRRLCRDRPAPRLSPAVRWLADPRVRIVQEALLYRHGTAYELLAYVVMPSHCHIVFAPLKTARAVGLRGKPFAVAQASHGVTVQCVARTKRQFLAAGVVRPSSCAGPMSLARVVDYVERNPVKQGYVMCLRRGSFRRPHAAPMPRDRPGAAACRCRLFNLHPVLKSGRITAECHSAATSGGWPADV